MHLTLEADYAVRIVDKLAIENMVRDKLDSYNFANFKGIGRLPCNDDKHE